MSASNVNGSFTPFKVVPVPFEGRRYAIPDIHGCLDTFLALLTQIDLRKADQLFLLGDYIDRGPNSKGVLDHILKLQEFGFQVFALRGNHEQSLIDAIIKEENETLLWYKDDWIIQLCDDGHRINRKYKDFLQGLPYYLELPDYYLAHAGFNFSKPEFLTAYADMLWIRNAPIDDEKLGNKRLIHGHTPTPLKKIKTMIDSKKSICLDNGAVFRDMSSEYGHLLCLDLDSLELTLQKNIDRESANF